MGFGMVEESYVIFYRFWLFIFCGGKIMGGVNSYVNFVFWVFEVGWVGLCFVWCVV